MIICNRETFPNDLFVVLNEDLTLLEIDLRIYSKLDLNQKDKKDLLNPSNIFFYH